MSEKEAERSEILSRVKRKELKLKDAAILMRVCSVACMADPDHMAIMMHKSCISKHQDYQ